MDFLKDIVNEIGGDYTKIASEIDETETYVDTGSVSSLMLLYLGLCTVVFLGTKLLQLLGKALLERLSFSLAVVKNFLDTNPDAYCLYFDTEAAINKVNATVTWYRP